MRQSKSNSSRIKSARAVPVDYHRALLKVLKLESAPIRYGRSIREIARALGRHPDTVERAMRYLHAQGVVVKKHPPWYLRPDGKDSRTALYFFTKNSEQMLGALGMEAERKLIAEFDPAPDADRREGATHEFTKKELDALMEEAAERAIVKYVGRQRVRRRKRLENAAAREGLSSKGE